MNERPIIKLELSFIDKTLEVLGWISIFVIVFLTISNYHSLPDTIPVHYNASGIPDRFGGKSNIFTLPILAVILYIGLTFLNKFPHVFNYPTKITAENAYQQYTNATRLIRYLKFIIVVIFGLIAYRTIQIANGQFSELDSWFLPLTLALVFIPLIYFLIASFTAKRPL